MIGGPGRSSEYHQHRSAPGAPSLQITWHVMTPLLPSTVHDTIREQNIEWIRFVWTDNAGLIRAKAVHTSALEPYLERSGVGIAAAQLAIPSTADALAPDAGLTPAGEVFMWPDWSTFTALPYTPAQARVLTDIRDEAGQPWTHCPRGFMRRMIERLAARGLELRAAFENEFYLLRPDSAGWVPVDRTVFGQTAGLDRLAPALDELTAALVAQGLQPEMLYAESGGGQFELPIRYRDALGAADQQVVFRETVRGVAQRHGLIASFLPKIFLDQAGSGAHLHWSLWQDQRNLTADPADRRQLGPETTAFAAGLLAHLPALMALTTPSPNSFKRIRPRFWSGAYTCWGYGNREAALRVPTAPTPDQPPSNVELKTVDPTCNPYLALGAVIAAGLDGVERGLSLGEPVQCDPADLPESERQARGIQQLPTDLGAALSALAADTLLAEAFGPAAFATFLAVRRAEWAALHDLPHDDEVRLLIERY
jgi:glutamine synthetase